MRCDNGPRQLLALERGACSAFFAVQSQERGQGQIDQRGQNDADQQGAELRKNHISESVNGEPIPIGIRTGK